ncbi:hypothetical protein SynBIOSE41_02534 [Synechococcus sp. BIOS-E4-1]|nr:hypothetical protein SynBIOSE41_02534 [Synechococcus sp. BIOS-E4-1]
MALDFGTGRAQNSGEKVDQHQLEKRSSARQEAAMAWFLTWSVFK